MLKFLYCGESSGKVFQFSKTLYQKMKKTNVLSTCISIHLVQQLSADSEEMYLKFSITVYISNRGNQHL